MTVEFSNNSVVLRGKIVNGLTKTFSSFNENYYEGTLAVKRFSGKDDLIPITINEKLLKDDFNEENEYTFVGQLRSFNKVENNKNKLFINFFVKELSKEDVENPNVVEMVGFICKEPQFRVTPLKREICDFLIAVNREFNKSDYLPCIAWERNARFIKGLRIGQKIHIVGRIQSREYEKTVNNEKISQVAYEISITKVETI